MELKFVPHVSVEKTIWGTVTKSHGQDHVLLQNIDTGEWIECGKVTETHFLPLAGLGARICKEVTERCSSLLGRKLESGMTAPSFDEITDLMNDGSGQ